MKNRLDQFMKSEGLTPGKLSEIMGVQPSNISHILSGRNNPGFDFITKLLGNFPKLNPDWIIMGTSSMYRPDSHPHYQTKDGLPSEVGMNDQDRVIDMMFDYNVNNISRNTLDDNIVLPKPSNIIDQDRHSNRDLFNTLTQRSVGSEKEKSNEAEQFVANLGVKEISISNSKKELDRIIFFYKDHRFIVYTPDE